MSGPIVFISKWRIKAGKLDGLKHLSRQVAPSIEAGKPGTVAFLAYLNEDGTEVSIAHVFPDATSMDLHVQGSTDRTNVAFEFIEPAGIQEIYGTPSDQTLEMMRKEAAEFGIALSIRPQYLSGFIRLKSG